MPLTDPDSRSRSPRWLALVLLLSLSSVGPASLAYISTVPLDGVETEEDLYEVYLEGNIDPGELTRLLSLIHDPIDLNAASRDRLYDLPGLTWPMVDAIIAFRDKEGHFSAVEGLARVPGLPRGVVEVSRAFVEVRRPAPSG